MNETPDFGDDQSYYRKRFQNNAGTIVQGDIVAERGWTLGMVKKYLGKPAFRKPNSIYGTMLCVYRISDVEEVEKNNVEFQKQFLALTERRKAKKEAAAIALKPSVAA